MRYELVCENFDGRTIELDGLRDIPGFTKTKSFQIDDIMDITTSFNNEEEFKNFLLFYGLIKKEDLDSYIKIVKYKSQKDKVATDLKYSAVVYKENEQFYNPKFLKTYFSNRVTNVRFMEKFIREYCKYLNDIPPYRDSLLSIESDYRYYLETGMLRNGAKYNMESFVLRYISKKDKNKNYVQDPLSLHKLAAFALTYEQKLTPDDKYAIKKFRENEEMKKHYQELLEDNATLEEIDAYNKKISELDEDIDLGGR